MTKKKNINVDAVATYLREGFRVPFISKVMSASVATIRRVMSRNGLYVRNYDNVTDEMLENFVRVTLRNHPTWGFKRVQGLSRCPNFKMLVPRRRLRNAYKNIVGQGNVPARQQIIRRHYLTRSPMSMWHLDTCHQLITFKFVIFGATDGFSRYIMYLNIASNNKAVTHLKLFKEAAAKYGLPSRARSDQGGENVLIADYMIAKRGINRSSFITGSSTHNTRIERLWLELLKATTGTYYNLFYKMVEDGLLNPDSNSDLFCLHFVAMDLLQRALHEFRKSWNNHCLSTEREKSPRQLFIAGLAQLVSFQKGRPIFDELKQTNNLEWDPSYHHGRQADGNLRWKRRTRVRQIECPIHPTELDVLRVIFDPTIVTLRNLVHYFTWVKRYVDLCLASRHIN